ncbi:Protein MKS1 [Acorus calamus]|uniref:Protein MKS1 n=1 Tax=Acorus calamus TaxID=4465 RepID=A0AAV9EAE0_ACOCL|nr:Protein MKS1 [Acorus calamus]
MDPSESRPSPRRELQLQGPRPTPLKVRKDSYQIKKPPIHPPHQPNLQSHQPQPHQRREPIIIYAVSPKVIHASAADFMSLVQRLTGPSPRASASSAATDGAPSPAARLASVEHCARRAATAPSEFDAARIEFGGAAPGILSPLPTCLPPISPSLFLSPVAAPTSAGGADGGSLGFLHELSPMFNNNFNFNFNYNNNINNNNNINRGIVESAFMPSPSNFMPSPSTWEFINQFSNI